MNLDPHRDVKPAPVPGAFRGIPMRNRDSNESFVRVSSLSDVRRRELPLMRRTGRLKTMVEERSKPPQAPWEEVYRSKDAGQVSWFQPRLEVSLALMMAKLATWTAESDKVLVF